ncbi:MAG: DUF1684 domain-containing protein, partial [Limisphaerales bacterium]
MTEFLRRKPFRLPGKKRAHEQKRSSLRIQAKFTAWTSPHSLVFHNTIGQEEREPSPGYVTFQKGAREFRLEPMLDEGKLFFVLRDQTSG